MPSLRTMTRPAAATAALLLVLLGAAACAPEPTSGGRTAAGDADASAEGVDAPSDADCPPTGGAEECYYPTDGLQPVEDGVYYEISTITPSVVFPHWYVWTIEDGSVQTQDWKCGEVSESDSAHNRSGTLDGNELTWDGDDEVMVVLIPQDDESVFVYLPKGKQDRELIPVGADALKDVFDEYAENYDLAECPLPEV